MATSNRAALFTTLHKVLKKHFEPVAAPQRNVMENLLYACCLEDARYESADDCFARVQELYFDWNEVRVTTVRELGELFKGIPNPTANALNLKNTLQSVFESQYSFDLEPLKKQNLGKAVALLEAYKGTTQFSLAYVTQMNLGGHSIPLGKSGIDIMYIIGAINEKEAAQGHVPGLERAIPKNKGVEFGSLLHQLAAELQASPFSQKVRSILLEVNEDCKDRLPKRADKKRLEAEQKKKEEAEKKKIEAARQKQQEEAEVVAAKRAASEKRKKKAAVAGTAEATPDKKKVVKKVIKKKIIKKKIIKKVIKKKAADAPEAEATATAEAATDATAKKTTKKKTTAKKAEPKTAEPKKTAAKKSDTKKAATKKTAAKKTVTKAKKVGKKSTTKQLSRKKPR